MPRSLADSRRRSLLALALLALGSALAAPADSNCGSSPCMYGICVDADEENDSSYRCYCIDGYTGINCETNWDDCWSSPCLNGGTCHDAVAAYNCSCPEGFVGARCEQSYSQCTSQPCLNNGTCSDHERGGVSCQCLEGFSGEFCEVDATVCNGSLCQNGAECLEGPGLSFSCQCPEGWLGPLCERDLDECGLAAPCRNGGLCINLPGGYQCACLFGFTGKDCDKPVAACHENPCLNGAVCLLEDGQPVCYCVPDYHGLLCEQRYDDCQSKFAHCQNGGSCVDGLNSFTCSCPPPYAGDSCASVSATAPAATAFPPTPSASPGSSLDSSAATELPASTASAGLGTSTDSRSLETTSLETTSVPEVRTELGSATELELELDLATTTTAAPTTTTTTTTTTTATTAAVGTNSTGTVELGTELAPSTSQPGERPAEADQAETTLPVDAAGTTTVGVVTMRPSSIASGPGPDLDAGATTLPGSTADDDFTWLTDFHRSTFGSDIDGGSTPPSTAGTEPPTEPPIEPPTEPPAVHACTSDQCANTTRCLHDASQCDCSYRDNCRARPSLSSAAFGGQSYIRQKFGIDSGGLSVLLRLRTKASGGIVMHALFDDDRYVLLYMEAGQLKFQFSCGAQTMLFGELDSPVNNGHEAQLEMRFQYVVGPASDSCSARLLVNDSVAMSGEQLLQAHESVPRVARLHLGGIPLALSRHLPQIVLGFVGCMSLLEVNGRRRDFLRDSVEAVQVEECHSFLCLPNPCKNFGACRELAGGGGVECSCIAGYSGRFCERSICDEQPCHLGATCLMSPGLSFLCVCPLGAHGLLCERDASITQPSFSVPAPGFSSYVAYGLSGSPRDGLELRMRIEPQDPEQISLIAFLGQGGQRRESSDHLSVTYVRGYLMLTWDLGSGVRRIFTASPIDARARRAHALRVGRRGRDSWLYVEGVGNVSARAAGASTRLDVSPILYIGGHKAKYFDSLPHDLPLHTGFSGCIYDIELRTDDSPVPITTASPATGRGVGQCHRNECSHHSCKNGAVCLNYGPTYSCICMKDWQGPDCSNPVNCTSSDSCH